MVAEQTTSQVTSSLMERVKACQARGLEFLLANIDRAGRPAGAPEHHARLPWTLAAAGARAEGAAVLSWHEREVLTEDGDLRAGANRDKWSMRWAAYPLSMLAHGSWMLERYDTAEALMRTLREYQDPESGGAYAERPEVRSSQRQDLFPTAQLGMTTVMTGHEDVAEGCFRWIADLYDMQDELPRRLFSARDENGLMRPTDGGTEADYGKTVEWEVVTDFMKPRQTHYNPESLLPSSAAISPTRETNELDSWDAATSSSQKTGPRSSSTTRERVRSASSAGVRRTCSWSTPTVATSPTSFAWRNGSSGARSRTVDGPRPSSSHRTRRSASALQPPPSSPCT